MIESTSNANPLQSGAPFLDQMHGSKSIRITIANRTFLGLRGLCIVLSLGTYVKRTAEMDSAVMLAHCSPLIKIKGEQNQDRSFGWLVKTRDR
jgi:hypothetical protein